MTLPGLFSYSPRRKTGSHSVEENRDRFIFRFKKGDRFIFGFFPAKK